MNTKLLTEADAALHEVEMAARRKQMAPLVNDLLKPEAKADCAKLAIFDELVECFDSAMHDFNFNGYDDLIKRARAIQASVSK